jgi:RNA polymerase sigma-70 factor (ECF subfamily)
VARHPQSQAEGQALALTLAAFNALVDEHGPALYRIAYRLVGDRHEAEDVVQETYRSAWKSRESYESGRGDRAWLAAILRRRVIDRLRRHAPPQPFDVAGPHEVSTPGTDPFAGLYTDEMQQALTQLPAELRETLLLVVVGELTHQEVADLLEVPLGTVLSRVSRARRRLRELLIAAKT